MIDFFRDLHPILQALIATCFTWAVTALGAAVVFTAKDISRRVLDGMLGFAGGVMIAASFWSLLAPAIEMSKGKIFLLGFRLRRVFLQGAFFYGESIKRFHIFISTFPWRKPKELKRAGGAAFCSSSP